MDPNMNQNPQMVQPQMVEPQMIDASMMQPQMLNPQEMVQAQVLNYNDVNAVAQEEKKSVSLKKLALFLGIIEYTLFILIYIIIIVAVVFVQESERRIPIQYSNQTTSSYGAKQNYIPFKLNSANVMPVIFASVIFTVPTFIAGLMKGENGFVNFVNKYVSYTTPVGFIVYIVLIFAFSFLYTFIQVNPEELAKNLSRQGGYIPGVRPGKETIKYIKTVLGRITLIGALFISIIAGLPIIVSNFLSTNLPTSVSIGGTSILIVVGVALETCRQLESSLINRNYGRRSR